VEIRGWRDRNTVEIGWWIYKDAVVGRRGIVGIR